MKCAHCPPVPAGPIIPPPLHTHAAWHRKFKISSFSFSPRAPLSPPPCSRPHTSKLLTRHTLSEFLTPVPPSLWTSSPVISLDCRAASHLFSLLSLSSLFLPSCSLATRHLPHPPPRLGTGVLPASLPPPLRLFTSWHHVLLLTCLLISVGLELRWSTVLFIGPVFNAGWNG